MVEIKVPVMGESITEATVAAILKESGSFVEADEEIMELETDKVNQVIYAPASGVLEVTVSLDQTVTIGEVIGSIQEGEGKPAPKKEASKPQEEPKPQPKPKPPTTGHKIRQAPEEFFQEKKQEKVEKEEITIEIPATRGFSGSREESRKRMPKIRRVIAERLLHAVKSTAMLTTFNEVDMTQVMQIRAKNKESFMEKHDVKLGFMSFFVKACVSAMAAFPDVNSYIDGDELVQRHYYDIGIAVGTERGLVVPVVRNCDQLSFAEVEREILTFAKNAREGKLAADDLLGGGFTITNGGVYGSLLSTPILNPPQCAILGMHKIMNRPIADGDQVVIRPMMYLALSYDHRVIDGQEAVSFLNHIKGELEDPSKLILDL